MKKNKAFTLVELIAVITILGIIALITVPAINGAVVKSKEQAYVTQKNSIIAAAKKWNLDNVGTDVGKIQINYDVLFIIDVTGSMGGSRFINTIGATNQIIKLLMSANPSNRIQVIMFSDTTSTLLNLDHYVAGTDGNFLVTTGSNSAITSVGLTNSSGQAISGNIVVTGDTNLQFGIQDGVKKFITSIKSGGAITHVPSVVLLTDGDPSYAYSDYINLEASTKITTNPEMHYNIVKTAQYYKNLLSTETTKTSTFYTIGLDLTDASALAELDPTPTKLANYTGLRDLLESVSNTVKPYNYADMSFTGSNMTEQDILEIFKVALASAISDTGKVTIKTLVDAGFIEDTALIDPRTGTAMVGYVNIAYDSTSGTYSYSFVAE